ncbi:cation:proton antiporter [Roseobacter sinensis]|uniref:Cation:proton antiporter n=1 Tax=Roseobacter sinensis TaxID=2931391 RepID=A0ABT3BD53_9RHOB|nr:cation:proton antiporter [Roseobacter sp. WL0113]MCV3271506.1 cation:proton antiporter [Roseobacter sp. WL0113]
MIQSEFIVAIGFLLLLGLLADHVGRRTRVPRVSLLLLCGVVASATGLIPQQLMASAESVTAIALALVAFLLGGSFKIDLLRSQGMAILCISAAILASTLVLVGFGLYLLGAEPALALLLASIATATAPAATLDVIRQSGVSNSFTQVVEGVVAVDDAWGLLAFSFCLAVAAQIAGDGGGAEVSALRDIGGAVLLGALLGLPAAYVTGRIEEGEPLLVEALAIAFLIAGLASLFDVSFLMSGIVAGALVANLARHHRKAFHEIEHIQWPFMIVFFFLAGAALDLASIPDMGVLGAALVLLRTAARLLGGWIGAAIARAPKTQRALFGPALLPQAGVAIGMALLAGQALPQWRDQIMALTIGTTVVFELFGPVIAMWAIRKTAVPGQPAAPGS